MGDSGRLRIAVMGVNHAPERSGIAPYTSRLAQSLAEHGHDVQVLTSRPHYPEWRVPAGYRNTKSADSAVRVRRFRHYIPRRPSLFRRMLFELSFGSRLAAARWGEVDVLICVSPALFSTRHRRVASTLTGTTTGHRCHRPGSVLTGSAGGRGRRPDRRPPDGPGRGSGARHVRRGRGDPRPVQASGHRCLGRRRTTGCPSSATGVTATRRSRSMSPSSAGRWAGGTTKRSCCTPARWVTNRVWRTWSRPPGSPRRRVRLCASCCWATAVSVQRWWSVHKA